MTQLRQPTPLRPVEKAALAAYRAAKRKAGMPPDLLEVAAELNQTKMNAKYLLDRLVKKGRLLRIRKYRGYVEPSKRVTA